MINLFLCHLFMISSTTTVQLRTLSEYFSVPALNVLPSFQINIFSLFFLFCTQSDHLCNSLTVQSIVQAGSLHSHLIARYNRSTASISYSKHPKPNSLASFLPTIQILYLISLFLERSYFDDKFKHDLQILKQEDYHYLLVVLSLLSVYILQFLLFLMVMSSLLINCNFEVNTTSEREGFVELF